MKGYTGKILHVNLSDRMFKIETPPESFYRKYIGGACMGAYYLLKNQVPGSDPFSSDNTIAITISAIVGARISGNARHCITTKSPLTNGIISSESGGYWGPELKFAGFDGLVITGKSESPVYLWIHDGHFELRDASSIWGLVTGEAQDIIREELEDDKVRVLLIGPSGEKLVRFANIVNELKHFNGRGGIGAVMGSKNLKAIAVRGTGKPEFFNEKFIREMAKIGVERVIQEGSWNDFRCLGTTQNVEWNSDIGGLPTRNWSMGTFEGSEKISAEKYVEEMMDKSGTCWACAQRCKRDVKEGITIPRRIDARYGGPEYETIGMLGSNCMVSDLHAIAKTNEIASKYGLDTISLGGVIGFVMECYENNLISKEQLGGITAEFGNQEALIDLSKMIATRDGFGFQMGEGVARLSDFLGEESENFAITVKKKEFPAHSPFAKGMMALIYAVGSLGPDHVSTEHDGSIENEPSEIHKGVGIYDSVPNVWELNFEKTKAMAYSERFVSAIDSFSVCQFCFHTYTIYDLEDLINIFNAATGWHYTMQELMLLGERRINLMRVFNAREGFTSKDDKLPKRFFFDPLEKGGPRQGAVVDKQRLFECINEYYRINGWHKKSGNPTDSKLRELGLGWVLEQYSSSK